MNGTDARFSNVGVRARVFLWPRNPPQSVQEQRSFTYFNQSAKEVRGMKSDFYTAIAQIAAERGIPREAVLTSVEHALKTVYKKMANSEEEVEVEIDSNNGAMRVFVIKRVVDEIEDPLNDMLPAEAQRNSPGAQVGDVIRIERTPDNFGRIAAQTAKQVVLQRIRDFERDTVYDEFADRQGEVINGVVQRADSRAVI